MARKKPLLSDAKETNKFTAGILRSLKNAENHDINREKVMTWQEMKTAIGQSEISVLSVRHLVNGMVKAGYVGTTV